MTSGIYVIATQSLNITGKPVAEVHDVEFASQYRARKLKPIFGNIVKKSPAKIMEKKDSNLQVQD